MLKHYKLAVCVLTLLTWQTQVQAQKIPLKPKLVEKVVRKGNELVIPYEKYLLPNGLTVVVHEDHSDPIVQVDVTYHVGSAREEVGKSGFAHFFEHMMFQGSDNVADEEHFKIVSEAGGTLNGSTNRDRTNYFETLPSNQLETALWLEADRMGFLMDAVTQKKFEIQRATVKNERGQNYDNRPYGLVFEKNTAALYPYGHPYSWTTIGYLRDLNRGNVQDLKNFFLRWYGPNNATLTVGGDVTPAQVVKLAEKYFGPIKRGVEVKNMKLPAPVLTQDKYISYEDNVRFPLLQMTFPTVPNFHPDEVPLDLLAEILGQGKNSILYKNLVKSQKAVQAGSQHPCTELAGEFSISVLPFPGQTLAEMEKTIRESLVEFEKTGVSEDALTRFKVSYEANEIDQLSSVDGKTSILANYQVFTGNPNFLPNDLKRYKAVTREDVMRVYAKYIKGKHAVILSVVPKGKSADVAHADNFTVDSSGYVPPKDQYAGLKYIKATDTFDRKKRPGSGANPVIKVPPFWNDKAGNGIKVIGTKNDEVPTVSMLFSIKGGHKLEAKNPGKAGIASLTAAMLNESSKKYTSEQLSSELDKLGSSINFSAGPDQMTVSMQSLTKNLDATLVLLEERMLYPRFDSTDFDRLKKQTLESIANQSTQASVVAANVYNKMLYGNDNILSIPVIGTTSSVSAITLDDVKNFYRSNFSPSVTNLVIVGDIEQNTIMPKLGFLSKWEAKPVEMPATPKVATIEKTKIFLVNKDKAAQSEIRIGYIALPFDATGEFYRVNIMNYILGGAFNSRINLNLREDKGYTYGAGSYFSGSESAGPYTAYAGVRSDVTDSSVVEFMKEIKRFEETGITDQELAFVKSAMGQSDARKYETAFQKAAFLNNIIRYNLDLSFVSQQSAILQGITKDQVNALSSKYLTVDKMSIVVVGDKATIKPGLEKLGYEIVELDPDGNPVKM
ncbi:Protease, insulinase family/protease, insulinase family [Arcticibacter svalbardensis MN12-7]|uniref:Protease, insulinase family/protease, insulinase family n=1 Tax=Arcticibacter svalbardensis MN12-7 TaxID=1150600 RepID=R9GS47_9SPHI|nr:pitrilysin family protein [Arcticibacter svalbardensis]EOR94385.1 Protease, insulinase family/protease, insulinase family [Arcticibacter svalbardensis MN12-7]